MTNIIPVGIKSYDSVRGDLVKQWISNRQKEMLPSVVEKIVERVHKGNGLQSQAAFAPYDSSREKDLKPTDLDKFPVSVLQEVFKQKEGINNLKTIETPKGTYIIVVNKIMAPDMTKDPTGFDETKQSIRETIASELTANVVAAYAHQFGVKINDNEIKKAFVIDSVE